MSKGFRCLALWQSIKLVNGLPAVSLGKPLMQKNELLAALRASSVFISFKPKAYENVWASKRGGRTHSIEAKQGRILFV